MTKWEYKWAMCRDAATMSELGADGWEIVSAVWKAEENAPPHLGWGTFYCLFKRVPPCEHCKRIGKKCLECEGLGVYVEVPR